MKIIRDGKEIELTKEELFSAYQEQENLFDVQNIKDNMDNYLDEDEYEILKDNKDFIEEAAYELRLNQDDYDMNFENAIKDAFEIAKLRHFNRLEG